MSSLGLTSIVDFRPLIYFDISLLKTRTLIMPMLIERAKDHRSIPADIVRLVFEDDCLFGSESLIKS